MHLDRTALRVALTWESTLCVRICVHVDAARQTCNVCCECTRGMQLMSHALRALKCTAPLRAQWQNITCNFREKCFVSFRSAAAAGNNERIQLDPCICALEETHKYLFIRWFRWRGRCCCRSKRARQRDVSNAVANAAVKHHFTLRAQGVSGCA